MNERNAAGVISVPSKYSVPETMDRLESLAKKQGIKIFARIDFSGDAAKAGLKMNQTQMLIFGNPKAGTPLIIASPLFGTSRDTCYYPP